MLIYKNDEHLVSVIGVEYNYIKQEDSGLRTEEECSLQKEEATEKLNVSLNEMGCSPLKQHGLGEII